MVRVGKSPGTTITMLLLVSVLILFPTACTSSQDTVPPPPPSPSLPEKGNPKLDSALNQLVSAERRGEAASFAKQTNITLVNGDVRVVIECVPGQLEAATEAATNAGAKVEVDYKDLLQVTVPVASLSTLADAESIHFIRLPQQPLPAPSN